MNQTTLDYTQPRTHLSVYLKDIVRFSLLSVMLVQWFSIYFEGCTPSVKINYFRTPCTIFVKKENKQTI